MSARRPLRAAADRTAKQGYLFDIRNSIDGRIEPVNVSADAATHNRLFSSAQALLVLRIYLGVIFLWAGIDKFANQAFLDPDSANGIKADLAVAAGESPIAFLVKLVDSYPTPLGIAIAFTEIFIGLGLVFGLWTRVWAVLGIIGQISIALTVGWGIKPGYESPNVPYIFALLPFVALGSGACSLDNRLAARRAGAVGPDTQEVRIDRRFLLGQGAVAAVLIAVGGAIAGLGRAAGSATTNDVAAGPVDGTLTTLDTLKAEKVVAFTDPTTNEPGVITLDDAGNAVAFSAVCTHSGCTVRFDAEVDQLKCRCHGSKFEPLTGEVINGPAKRPLPPIGIDIDGAGNVTLQA